MALEGVRIEGAGGQVVWCVLRKVSECLHGELERNGWKVEDQRGKEEKRLRTEEGLKEETARVSKTKN